jgi:hypothetical protein
MAERKSDLGAGFWNESLENVDREVARLATICKVRILEPGVIERVVQGDETVCGSKNPPGFQKLRQALMMHYHVRDQAVGAIGQAQTTALVHQVVDRLRARFGDALGKTDLK